MVKWDFNPDDYEENAFAPIPQGKHRVRIREVEEKISKSSGNDMLVLTLDVSGYASTLWFYLVFMPDNPKMTNQRIGEICESFGLDKPSPQAIIDAVGKVGAANVKHDLYEGKTTAKINYFLTRKQAEVLPAWVEPSRGTTEMPAAAPTNAALPFDLNSLPDVETPF